MGQIKKNIFKSRPEKDKSKFKITYNFRCDSDLPVSGMKKIDCVE